MKVVGSGDEVGGPEDVPLTLLVSPHSRKAARRDRMWQHRLAVLRRCPVRSDGDDDVRAGAERVIKVKVAGRRLRDGIDLHASHVCRRARRDRRLHGARVVSVHLHRRARVEVPVVHGVLGYHRREHEELARSGNCCLYQDRTQG